MNDQSTGLQRATECPLFTAIFNRRSRRISKGIASVPADSLSYKSTQEAQLLTPLEEALLTATAGSAGVAMHDTAFKTQDGKDWVRP